MPSLRRPAFITLLTLPAGDDVADVPGTRTGAEWLIKAHVR